MSRIEIPLSEYTALKKKITKLEKTVNEVSKEASTYKEKLGEVETLVLDLKEEGLVGRIFSWNKITKPLLDLVGNG